jgi:hypothetical protein
LVMRYLAALVTLPLLAGVSHVQVTSTQAILTYTAPDASRCRITVPGLDDLDETLFPGSSFDAGGALARQFVIGKNTANLASDGRMHSRALAADTSYSGTLLCSGVLAPFTLHTNTIPLGDSSPNPLPYDANGFGHLGFPTIDYSNPNASYVDPQTGATLKPLQLGGYAAAGITRNFPLKYAYANNWTNASAIPAGGTATYTGLGGTANTVFFPLHLDDGGRGWMFYLVTGIDDLKIHLKASSTLSGDYLNACLTLKGSMQCASNPFELSLATGVSTDTYGPGPDANTFQFRFARWAHPQIGEDQTSQPPNPTVSVAHDLVTLTTPSPVSTPFMFPAVVGGTRIHIGTNEYTVKSILSATQLRLNEDAGVIASTSYSIENWGVLVWPAAQSASRTITVNGAYVDFAHSADFFVGVDGGYRFFQGPDVIVSTKADGSPMPPEKAKVGMIQSNWNDAVVGGSRQYLALLIKRTGEIRVLNRLGVYGNTQDPTDPLTIYEGDPVGNVSKCTYDPAVGFYKELARDWNNSTMNPAMRCTSGVLTNAIAQITAAYPQIDQSYFPFRFAGKFGHFIAYGAQVFSQDSMAMGCAFDLSRPAGTELLGCIDTWSHFGLRWGQSHGQGFSPLTDTGWFKFFSGFLGANGSPLGPYSAPITTVYGNGGTTAITAAFRDPLTCEALGVAAQWKSVGATGSNCIRVNVPEEPLVPHKSPGDAQLVQRQVGPRPYAHNSLACGGDGKTPAALVAAGYDCSVYLQDMLEGDWAQDSRGGGEFFLVAKKTKLPDGTIDLVLSRHVSAGNWPLDNSQAWCVGSDENHASGWALMMYPVKECTGNLFAVNALDPNFRTNPTWISDDPAAYGTHGALLYTPGNGAYSHWSVGSGHLGGNQDQPGYYGFGYGIASGHFPEIFTAKFPATSVTDELPFAYDTSGAANVQAHPGVNVRLDLNGTPVITGLDGRPFGGSHGGTPSPFDQSATLVPGTQHVYKMGLPSGTSKPPNVKLKALLGWYGHTILQDVSGPASTVTDAALDVVCEAYKAGECIMGSAPGDAFVSIDNADTSGFCVVNMMARTPCVSSVARHVFGYTEFGLQSDPMGNRNRVLTTYLNTPGSQENYANQHGGDDADWLIGLSRYVNGERSTLMGARYPRWTADSWNRTSFIDMPFQLSGRPGDTVRIRYGYNPKLFCTSRNEQCSTGAANKDPFAFAQSDTVIWQPCSSGCTVTVKSYANRMLYYQIDRLTAAGRLISSPIGVFAVP